MLWTVHYYPTTIFLHVYCQMFLSHYSALQLLMITTGNFEYYIFEFIFPAEKFETFLLYPLLTTRLDKDNGLFPSSFFPNYLINLKSSGRILWYFVSGYAFNLATLNFSCPLSYDLKPIFMTLNWTRSFYWALTPSPQVIYDLSFNVFVVNLFTRRVVLV